MEAMEGESRQWETKEIECKGKNKNIFPEKWIGREKNIINCQNIMQLNVNKIAANVINSLMQKCCLVYLYWIGRILTSVTLQKLRYNYLIAYKNHFVRQLNCLMRSGLDRGKTFLVYSFWHLSPVNYEICGIFSFSVSFIVCLSVSHLISLFYSLPLCLPFDLSGLWTPDSESQRIPFSW